MRASWTGRRGVLSVVAYAGVAVPGLLPIESGGVLCPPLAAGANAGPDWASESGGGVEVFTMGSAGEEGIIAPGERSEGLGVI